LLRRPFSIYDVENNTLKIIYYIKGKGTKLLKEVKPDESLNVTGPHGNSFPTEGKNVLVVGGGFGVAPLAFYAKRNRQKNIFAAVGGRTEKAILCKEDLNEQCRALHITTEDGSMGEKGLITTAIERILNENEIDSVITVGPKPMMKAVAEISEKKNIPCFVSMEERMGCGVGVCLSCVCGTKNGRKRICKDGPIFNSKEIIW
jgi:dihydroorotate dehydrogenase electron transfer subunit